MSNICPLCKRVIEKDGVLVGEKGLKNIIRHTVQRGDEELRKKLRGATSILFHESCRKNYTRRISASENIFVTPPSRPPLLRSHSPNFNFRTACFLCGREVPLVSPGGPPRSDRGVSTVTAESVQAAVLNACDKRTEEWVRRAALRVRGTASLVKEGACYHRSCYMALLDPLRPEPLACSPSPRSSPLQSPSSLSLPGPSDPHEFKTPTRPSGKRPATSPADGSPSPSHIPVPRLGFGRAKRRPGRPVDDTKKAAFEELCRKIESHDECQFTMADLVAMMPPTETYTEQYLATLLKDKYKNGVVIVERPGQSSILCFLGVNFDMLGESWYSGRCKDYRDECRRIVKKAAEIIRSDILAVPHDPEFFPHFDGSAQAIVPESLTDFLHAVAMPRKKGRGAEQTIRTCETLAHCLISATRPRSFLSHIMLALGIWIHRKIGSKTLCEMMYNLGVSVPYSLIQEYEKSAVLSSSLDFDPEAYMQFVFDNFDFNTATIDGHRTVHSMGGMIFITPKTGVPPRGRLPRLSAKKLQEIPLSQFGTIPLQPYSRPPADGFSLVTATDQRPTASGVSLQECRSLSNARKLDLLWVIGNTAMPKIIPGWNGFMSAVMEEASPRALTATLPLPFVNLNPSDPTTIYTCLMFAAEQARRHGQEFCSVTFDQPLYWKATEIVLASPANSPLRKIVVRLGGFHLLMSFMGSIGHLMSGSGLEELWATVYAKNSVQHMSSGKAYSRAVRAHFLTQTALLDLVLRQLFKVPDIVTVRRQLLDMCRGLYRGESIDIHGSDTLIRVRREVDTFLDNLAAGGRTSRLWVEYIRQVELIRLLIRAERVGDWSLHLYAVKQMLPYFHAAGHLNYAKSAHLYIQLMAAAETSMPRNEQNKLFAEGFFSVRKHERLWAGNFSDQTIEMDLMRPLKSIGGITMHGRGINENTVAVYVSGMPYCAEVIQAFEKLCGTLGGTSEQHVELRDSRISRDAADLEKFRIWLEQRNPFDKPAEQLVCLASGVIADSTVNCEQSHAIGCAAMEKIVGKPFSVITLHRKDKAVPISSMNRSVTIRSLTVQVNPTQLFHRIIVAQKDVSELENNFAYELAPFPTSLFDENGMRKTSKSKLVDAVETLFLRSDNVIPVDSDFVVDGGFLLRKVVWPRPATYGDVAGMYTKYVCQHYGKSCTVVFDGYPDTPTTKDQEHNLRAAAGTSADLSFISSEMAISETQAKFLSNGKNKQQLIKLLTEALEQSGVAVVQAAADADRLIVLRAIEIAREKVCVVVGTDTDILVLLLALSPSDVALHFLLPGSGRVGPKVHHIRELQSAMGEAAKGILVAHPLTGTDTVSALYRGSKKKALQKLSDPNLREDFWTFLQADQTHDAVAKAGEKIILSLYGCSSLSNLDQARYFLYKRTIARQSIRAKFELASLPPTSAGARQHSFRVYLQVQEWLGNDLNPCDWGWKLESNQYYPVTTTAPPAPRHLLELISCNCRAGCGSGCSCVAALLKCSSICGHCAGVGCLNAENAHESEGESAEDDIDDPDEPSSFAL